METALADASRSEAENASVALALAYGDTVARIVGEPQVRFRHDRTRAADEIGKE